MTLRHLEIFVAVCEYGGITRAAEILHIAQPAVSHTIADLEKYYRIVLFDRINQRLILTDAGKELLPKAKELIGSFKEFEEMASVSGKNPSVHIGSSLTFGQTVIPAYLRKIANEHPEIQPRVLIQSAVGIENEIEKGNLDFAVIEGEITSPYLNAVPFQKDRLIPVANAASDIPDKLRLTELTAYPLLLRERGSASRDALENALAGMNLRIQPKIESVNNQALITAIYASLGITILPESFVRGHIDRGKFKELHIEGLNGNRMSYLVIHKNKRLNIIQKEAYNVLAGMSEELMKQNNK